MDDLAAVDGGAGVHCVKAAADHPTISFCGRPCFPWLFYVVSICVHPWLTIKRLRRYAPSITVGALLTRLFTGTYRKTATPASPRRFQDFRRWEYFFKIFENRSWKCPADSVLSLALPEFTCGGGSKNFWNSQRFELTPRKKGIILKYSVG